MMFWYFLCFSSFAIVCGRSVKDCSESSAWNEEPFACRHDRKGFFECTWKKKEKEYGHTLVGEKYFACPSGKVCWSELYDKKADDMCIDAPPKLIDVGFLSWHSLSNRYAKPRSVLYKTSSGKFFRFKTHDVPDLGFNRTYFDFLIPKDDGKGFSHYGGSAKNNVLNYCEKKSDEDKSQHLLGIWTNEDYFSMLGSRMIDQEGDIQTWYYELDEGLEDEYWKTVWTLKARPDETGQYLIPIKIEWTYYFFNDDGDPRQDEYVRTYSYFPVDESIEEKYSMDKWCPNHLNL